MTVKKKARRKRALKKRVLIVEDDRGQARVLQLLLSKNGFSTATAHTARDAISKLRGKIDLILLDLVLQGGMGDAVLHHVIRQRLGVPIIVVTGIWPPKTAEEKLKEVDPSLVFLTKPFDEKKLISLAGRLAGRSVEDTPQ